MNKKKIAVLGNGWAFEFINSVISGIKEVISKYNTDIYYFTCYKFHNPDKSENNTGYRNFDNICFSDYDGVIILANLFEDEESLQKVTSRIKKEKVPAVSLVRNIPGFSFIHVNNYIGYYNLINHLIDEHDVKNIGFIGGIKNDVQSNERYSAFQKALSEHNLPIQKKYIIENTDWSFRAGYKKGLEILQKEDIPQAIICSNDLLAYGIIRAAADLNLSIPDDIKIIGFDNDSLSAGIIPSISTVDTKAKEMGIKAAELLFSENQVIQDIELQSEPIIRQSCGCHFEYTDFQLKNAVKNILIRDEEERFSTHLRHTEDVFINDDNVYMFWENCQDFYVARHTFESDNFSILLKRELVESLLYQDKEYDDLKNCDEYQVFVNIQNGKKVKPEVIGLRKLLPSNMLSNESNVYVIIPLIYRNNFFGYYVSKNSMSLLFNKRGYTWAKNFSNSIEKFREKNKYRLLSQKYLGLSTRDALTGVFNRAAIELFANDIYETNRHSNLKTNITFIDINCLKIINDEYGHLHGDLTIKIVAEEIKKLIPDKWLPIRYGGDEFVIIGTIEKEEENHYLDTLNENLSKKKKRMSLPYNLSVSIGSIIVPPDSTLPLETEINNSDNEMYKNKQKFHEEMNKKNNSELCS